MIPSGSHRSNAKQELKTCCVWHPLKVMSDRNFVLTVITLTNNWMSGLDTELPTSCFVERFSSSTFSPPCGGVSRRLGGCISSLGLKRNVSSPWPDSGSRCQHILKALARNQSRPLSICSFLNLFISCKFRNVNFYLLAHSALAKIMHSLARLFVVFVF